MRPIPIGITTHEHSPSAVYGNRERNKKEPEALDIRFTERKTDIQHPEVRAKSKTTLPLA
jgi:hypothetical protein|tara:strand:- start:11537 stop:11716 length:180 start_codon:yes stop_codon:yes gene_type:complete